MTMEHFSTNKRKVADLKAYPKAAAKWVVETYGTLIAVEQESFRKMQLTLNPDAPALSRKRMLSIVHDMDVQARLDFADMLKGEYFGLTTDGWTSNGQDSYFGATVHWICSDFFLHSCPLGVLHHVGTSTAEDHLRELNRHLVNADLPVAKVAGLTTDTEKTMNATGRLVADNWAQDGSLMEHIGCVDHILNLTMKLAGTDPDVIGPQLPGAGALKQLRSLVGSFSHSTQLSDKLLGIQQTMSPEKKAVGLIQDIVTRWWSTYKMCDRALTLRLYLTAMQSSKLISNNLSDDQWGLIGDICQILKPFMLAQELLEGERYVTISLVPTVITQIRRGINDLLGASDKSEYVNKMVTTLSEALTKDWGSGALNSLYSEHLTEGAGRRHKGFRKSHMLAAYLDPRTKFLIPFGNDDKAAIENLVQERALLIAKELQKPVALAIRDGPALKKIKATATADSDDKYDGLFDRCDGEEGSDASDDTPDPEIVLNGAVADEMARYKMLKNLKRVQIFEDKDTGEKVNVASNPLDWWRGNVVSFPILSALARRILCIPASSAPSERLFSHAGLTIRDHRASLLPENAEALIFLHDALPVIEAWKKRKLSCAPINIGKSWSALDMTSEK